MSSGLERLDAGIPMSCSQLEKIGTTTNADAIICVGGGGLDAFQGFLLDNKDTELDNKIPILVLTGNFAKTELKKEARELFAKLPNIKVQITDTGLQNFESETGRYVQEFVEALDMKKRVLIIAFDSGMDHVVNFGSPAQGGSLWAGDPYEDKAVLRISGLL